MNRILLASKSPRRIELLSGIGVKFDIAPTECDEKSVKGANPADTAERIALLKCRTALESDNGAHEFIIASDTLVEASDGEILGKPADEVDAFRILRKLSGTKHYVHSGIAVAKNGNTVSAVETTAVHFLPITDEEIMDYIASGEPMDKAGAYGIQEHGGLFVTGIEGDYFNVMGLPLCRLNLLISSAFGVKLTEIG